MSEEDHVFFRGKKVNILIDCVTFQLNSPSASIWHEVIKVFSVQDGIKLTLLDRGGTPKVGGVSYIEFPSYNWHNTAADSLLIDRFGQEAKADIFLSSLYTTPTTLPAVLLVSEFDHIYKSKRCLAEKRLAAHHASYVICLSSRAYRQSKRFVNHQERLVRVAPEMEINVLKDFSSKIATLVGILRDQFLRAMREGLTPSNQIFQNEWHRLRSIQAEVDTWP